MNLVIAHWKGLRFFTDDDLARIGELATVLDPEPIADWGEPRAGELLAEADVVLGHWGCPPIDRAVVDRAPRLGLFAYAAGTVKGILRDDALFERGVRVTSGAPANAEPVAEYTLAAILLAGKNALWRRDALRDPSIEAHRHGVRVPIGNWGRTIGIVGASFVGRRVLELLREFPALDVVLHDPYVTAEEAAALGARLLDLDELCSASDVLSIHVPDLPSTRRMIGAPQLAALRDGATVVNTARGAVVDHDALVAELRTGRLYAVLDVTDPEPLPPDSPLRTLPNVFLTPHLAGSEGTELGRLTEHAVDEIRRWIAGEPARNEITKERLARLA